MPPATGPPPVTRCPQPSRRLPRPRRRCDAQPARRPPIRRRATPCRSTSKTEGQVLPSLSHVAPSGVAELSLRLIGSRQSPRPFPRHALLSNQGSFPPPALPGLHGTTSLSATLPARPGPRGPPVGACHATDRASRVAAIPLFHTCRRHYPGGTGRCLRRSLPDRWQPSPSLRRIGFRAARFEACSAFTRVAARVVAEPPNGGPLSSKCFSRCRCLHRPLRLLPAGATVAGRDSHPLGNGALSRRTEIGGLVGRCSDRAASRRDAGFGGELPTYRSGFTATVASR